MRQRRQPGSQVDPDLYFLIMHLVDFFGNAPFCTSSSGTYILVDTEVLGC